MWCRYELFQYFHFIFNYYVVISSYVFSIITCTNKYLNISLSKE